MAKYGVVMNQGVSMAQLGNNVLLTGHIQGGYLYSCSAIILINPQAGSAGLYHFPEGNIHNDDASGRLIQQMIQDVNPTEASIRYGTQDFRKTEQSRYMPPNLDNVVNLIGWLEGLLRFEPDADPAPSGNVSIEIANGQAIYGGGPFSGVTDLSNYQDGVYAPGFKVYWRSS
jgi:hypothetical protein